jgi:hypothetical protein
MCGKHGTKIIFGHCMWEIYFGHARKVLAAGRRTIFLESENTFSVVGMGGEGRELWRRDHLCASCLSEIVYEHSYSRSFDTPVS